MSIYVGTVTFPPKHAPTLGSSCPRSHLSLWSNQMSFSATVSLSSGLPQLPGAQFPACILLSLGGI